MRRDDHIVQAEKRIRWFPVVLLCRFLRDVVQTGASDPAFFQCSVEGTVIDDRSAGGIDEDGARLHAMELGLAYEILCF